MAAYDVDIQLAVKNLNTIKALKKELDAVEQALERISKLDTFDSSGFRARSKARQDEKNQVKEQIRLTSDLKKAESARRADLLRGVRLERQQQAIQLEEKLINLAKDRLHLQTEFNNKTEEGNRKARQATADFIRRQRILKQGLTQHASPIGPDIALRSHREAQQRAVEAEVTLRKAVDAVNMKYDLRLQQTKRLGAERRKAMQIVDREISFEKRLNKVLERRTSITKSQSKQRSKPSVSGKQRFGAAVSAGAFPLLFGGGPGMALGGALGGAITGSTFGPASIALQVLGGVFDDLAVKAATLGAGLNPLTADLDAITAAAGESSSKFSTMLEAIEEQLGAQRALEVATNRLATVIGIEAVNDLKVFSEDMNEIGDEFNKLMSLMFGGIAALINQAGILQKISSIFERKRLLEKGKTSTDPETVRLEKLRQKSINKGDVKRTGELIDEIVARQRNLELKELGLQNDAIANELGDKRLATLRNTTAELKAERKILEGNKNLLNDEVFAAERQLLATELTAKTSKIEQDFTKTKKAGQPANDKVRRQEIAVAVMEFENKLIELNGKRTKAQEAADSAANRATKQATREDERKQRAIDRRVEAVDREIERTEDAFNKASQQLDSITQKHEDKMAFEREYSRLIMEGSTPAAAKQAVELKKQLLELDRGYEKLLESLNAQILKTEASLQDLKNQKGVTDEYIKQQTELDKLKKDRDGLEGNKGKAKVAIEKDLASKTFLGKLGTESERLQGILNDLVDPANQVIAAASAIGNAFSESFKGVISGSMTAQEALANLFQRTADHFLDMTAQIIAAAIKMQAVKFVTQIIGSIAGAGVSSGSSFAGVENTVLNSVLPSTESLANAAAATPSFAEGGFVSRPTNALIGEGGEPEYVIPQSKMRESMSRYSRGSRGGGVIPSDGGSSASGDGGVAVAAPIDVRYTVERINSVDYVTADQFQSGMQRAASQGAQRGEQNTLKRLQMSGSTRKRLGL